jgi:hypothetical protein
MRIKKTFTLPRNHALFEPRAPALRPSRVRQEEHSVNLPLSVTGNDCGRVCTLRAIAVAVDEENIASLSVAEASLVAGQIVIVRKNWPD